MLQTRKGTFIEVKGYSHQMEGKSRPTFFRGVATVVTKLFNAVQVRITSGYSLYLKRSDAAVSRLARTSAKRIFSKLYSFGGCVAISYSHTLFQVTFT
jgi:hypothetical protein